MKKIATLFVTLFFGFLVNAANATLPVTDLGALAQGTYSQTFDMNDLDQVVGNGSNGTAARGYIWQNGVMTDLGTLGGNITRIGQSFNDVILRSSINNNGQVIGMSSLASGDYHGFIWQNGTMTDLGTLGGTYSYAFGINDSGQVVGGSYIDNNFFHAFRWQNGTMTDLGHLGGYRSQAIAINNNGQVVGESATPAGTWHAFLWDNGVMTDLGTLGGNNSRAYGINEAGQVIGWSYTSSGEQHGFVWQGGVMTDLGNAFPNDINNNGQVVGYIYDPTTGSIHAFIWQGGNMTDLGTFGGTRSMADSINNSGQVSIKTDVNCLIWQNGTITNLEMKYATDPNDAFDINEAGHAAGNGYVLNREHSLLWAPYNVGIDILPGDSSNTVNLTRARTVPVAIFSSLTFDATAVNVSTVTLEGAHVKQKANGSYMYSISDVNLDGLADMTCEINASQITLAPGTYNAVLKGQSTGGLDFQGNDTITILR